MHDILVPTAIKLMLLTYAFLLGCRHPYQKYGYGLVFLIGLSVYAAYTVTKVRFEA